LVRAIKHSSDDRIPEPSCHRVKSGTLPIKSNARRRNLTALFSRSCNHSLELRGPACVIFSVLVHSKSIKALLALKLVKTEAK
jgi:hypothetical protein